MTDLQRPHPHDFRSHDPEPNDETAESDFSENLSEEIRESFLGDEAIPRPRRNVWAFTLSVGRVALRLAFPRANQIAFAAGFWILRLVGFAVIVSWLYFGLSAEDHHFDRAKLWSGVVIALVGPLVLRAVEFVLENIALRGATPGRWRDFWNFRRMMTPRSIQTAFFIGFWVLVASGLFHIGAGLKQMIAEPRLRTDMPNMEEWRERLSRKLRDKDAPEVRDFLDLLSSETRRMITDPKESADAAETKGQPMSIEVYAALSEWLGEAPASPESGARDVPSPFSRILRGLLLLVLGPLALRFTCESIILFFRINETLTDISRQIERANRRLAQLEEREKDSRT